MPAGQIIYMLDESLRLCREQCRVSLHARVALTNITLAEYFRDHKGKDVLLFIDNILIFTQASSDKSALLGCIPSTLGYQPNLANQHEYHTGENHHHLEGLHLVLVSIVT